jgi:hypothetical protein
LFWLIITDCCRLKALCPKSTDFYTYSIMHVLSNFFVQQSSVLSPVFIRDNWEYLSLPKTNSDEGKERETDESLYIYNAWHGAFFFVRLVALEQPCRPQRPKVDDAIVIMDQWPYIVIHILIRSVDKRREYEKIQ